MKTALIVGLVVVALLVGSAWWSNSLSSDPSNGTSPVVARNGLHWHPELSIHIKGERVEVPGGVGLVGRHNPMHTHDPDGVIHLEYDGLVREDDIRLGKFFELWGKEFGSDRIFEHRTGPEGTVTMYVNGAPNDEYGDYLLQHEDKIEIRYE